MDSPTCPVCREPIKDTDSLFYRADTKALLHLHCEMRRREMANATETQKEGEYARYGSMT